ncbi:hypothetical protein ACHAPC_010899 [Botrytis cinerea]
MRSCKVSGAIPASANVLTARETTVSLTMEAQYDSSQVSHTVMRDEIKRMIGPIMEAVRKQGSGKFTNANLGSGTERTQDMFGQNYKRLRLRGSMIMNLFSISIIEFHQQNTITA